jgi:DNA-directed RNA polymerase subunit K/omega
MTLLTKEQRRTYAILTLYEKTAVIGTRAMDLQRAPESRICPIQLTQEEFLGLSSVDPASIAEKEFELGKIPLKIRRTHSDGCYELWDLSELKFVKV